MRLLISSIVRKSRTGEPSGWLHAVDLDQHAVLHSYPQPESPYLQFNHNPRGGLRGARGIAASRDTLFITNHTDIRTYTSSWKLQQVITHPCCADIHDRDQAEHA